MHITPEYCRTMARYNAWQNNGLRKMVETMDRNTLDMDRGAFFGSIRRTLNHILWADLLWMHRLADAPDPNVGMSGSVEVTPSIAEWSAQRFRTDGRITAWADRLRAIDLAGDLTWRSAMLEQELTRPIQPVIMHFFNHQTHHRGQVHAMLTAAGETPGDTDLLFLPDTR